MEYKLPNLNFNENRYSEREWDQVEDAFGSRRIWGFRVAHIAEYAGRTHYKSRLARWIYDRDLYTLAVPAAAVLVLCTIVMSVVGVMVL